MKKLYAFAITADRNDDGKTRKTDYGVAISNGFIYSSAPGYLVAENENEALGKAHQAARHNYPKEMGWTNHDVSVMEITPEWLAEKGFELKPLVTP